ncbi:class A beta-lactamase-related serine hydrolase [Pontibacter diazotrophicus]|uniref:Class A beta-lactamase-related serine hydrolase n=1 Tax=Pontibacter diazotrophicus TaxID=1400979 RepID=A0A3D8LAA3_9BACT|nr:serine hydrolase domain-containing protein [Pontibacter diazotrophicus]RDV14246.1 class A beta-lactamase-related serine hydrolase [Pontibacter diazotrophicus]
MAFLKIQFALLRCIIASFCCLFLISCQETGNDIQLDDLFEEEDSRQQVLIPASFTPDSARQLGTKVDSIFKHLHKRKGFNGTVLVTKYDQVIYKGAFGYADFHRKDTLTTKTAFQLASVSKQFTAMAIMILKEQGKLSYEDSVQQYIPDFPYKGITIRQLLTHRSGLPNYTYFSDELWPDRRVPITNGDVLNLMAVHRPRIFYKPNTHFDYSNTGYSLLAAIVDKASGMPFATFLQEQIFAPLEMKNTFTFSKDMAVVTESVATGYTSGRRKRTPDYLDTVLGDKGLYSTVEDLYKWDQALYTQKLVKRETLEEAFRGSRPEKKKDEDYGFGWRIRQLESGDTAVYHGGLWHGFNTYLLRNPKDHSAIIVLSNLTNGSLNYLKDVRRFLYPVQPVITASDNTKHSKAASAQL